MNKADAEKYIDQMSRDTLLQLMVDYYQLKQGLCAEILGVPTGTPDWVGRAKDRAIDLRECDHQLRKIIRECGSMLEDAAWKTKQRVCFNCRGTREVQGETCCICGGTGSRPF